MAAIFKTIEKVLKLGSRENEKKPVAKLEIVEREEQGKIS